MRRNIAMAGSLAFLALLLAAIAVTGPGGVGARALAATPVTDDALLRELAERLLSQTVGPPGQPIPAPQLLPGALPDDLPLTLPAVPDARLLGSVARRADGRLFTADIVYDAPGAPADLVALYERALAPQGWVVALTGGGGPAYGFQPSTGANGRAFCAPQGTTGYLTVQATARADAPLDLRLRLDLANQGPCGQGSGGPTRPPGSERLPALAAPAGVQIAPSGGGGGGNRFTSSAYATSALPVDALHDAYAEQLAAAGWTRVEGGVDGPLAWSTWRIPGAGDFAGFLYVLRTATPNQAELYVQAAAPYGGPLPAPTRPTPAPGTPAPAVQPAVPTRTTLVPSAP